VQDWQHSAPPPKAPALPKHVNRSNLADTGTTTVLKCRGLWHPTQRPLNHTEAAAAPSIRKTPKRTGSQ